MQVIEVNLLAWFIARHFNWSFEWRYQVSALLTVLVLGWITKIMLTSFIQGPLILIMIASFAVYLLLLICSVYLVPQLIGINRKQLDSSLVFVIEKFKALK